MEVVMDCLSFWAFIAAGSFVVPLLQFLKALPKVGPVVEQWAFLVAPLLSALAPAIAQAAMPLCQVLDPLLWTAIYALATYAISQIVYQVGKKSGLVK
jgi:hypothetical protein